MLYEREDNVTEKTKYEYVCISVNTLAAMVYMTVLFGMRILELGLWDIALFLLVHAFL